MYRVTLRSWSLGGLADEGQHLLIHVFQRCLDDALRQAELGAKDGVHRLDGDAGLGGDLTHGDAGVAARGEEAARGLEDAAARGARLLLAEGGVVGSAGLRRRLHSRQRLLQYQLVGNANG